MPKNTPETSIIIRTVNEERFLGRVLESMKGQTYRDFELIIVDDNSTDKTLEIAKQYDCKIINIPKGRFSHPYSCNLGAENARGRYLVYLNGHSIPISETWLESGLRNFRDEKIAGVYALPIAHEEGTLTDKLLWNIPGYTIGSLRLENGRIRLGLLATINAAIRKDLWQRYKFNERFAGGWGGEDVDWAVHHINLGYKIVHDPEFRVRHSHFLKPTEFFWQIGNWAKMLSRRGTPKRQKRNF